MPARKRRAVSQAEQPSPPRESPANLTEEQLKELQDLQKKQRLAECQHEVRAVLAKHNCDLAAQPRFTEDGRTVAVPLIVAK